MQVLENLPWNPSITAGMAWKRKLNLMDSLGAPFDLTGYTVNMNLKRTLNGDTLFSLGTANGRISISPVGKLSFSINPSDNNLSGNYIFDLVITSPEGVSTVVRNGSVMVAPYPMAAMDTMLAGKQNLSIPLTTISESGLAALAAQTKEAVRTALQLGSAATANSIDFYGKTAGDGLNTRISAVESALPAKASVSYVDGKIAALMNAPPAALDTLKELADALGGDANFSTTVLTAIGLKADTTALTTLAGRVTTAEGSISGYATRLTALESGSGSFAAWKLARVGAMARMPVVSNIATVPIVGLLAAVSKPALDAILVSIYAKLNEFDDMFKTRFLSA